MTRRRRTPEPRQELLAAVVLSLVVLVAVLLAGVLLPD